MAIDHEPAPPNKRMDCFEEDNHQCRLCGALGTQCGGCADLEAHHITPLNEGGDHSLENLVTLCHECHRWYHSLDRLRGADPRLGTISYEPSPTDLLIVLALGTRGPATTRTIAELAGTTVESASQRLYKLTALGVLEPTADLHDYTETAKWGFSGTVQDSAVGELPADSKKAARLARDEMIRQRADRGETHGQIANDLGLSRRTVIKGIDRARALKPPVPDVTGVDDSSQLTNQIESANET